jgi:hypothetical protein
MTTFRARIARALVCLPVALGTLLGAGGAAMAGKASTATPTQAPLVPPASAPATAPAPAAAPAPAPAAAPAPAPAAAPAAPAAPRPPAPAPAVPPPARSVDAVLADVVQALGGTAALKRHKSLHMTMELEFQGLGIKGTAERFAAAGDKSLTITEIPNLASTREGNDGKRAWSEDPINGLRILKGAEAAQSQRESAWNAELRLKQLFPKIAVKNEVGADGVPLECLVLTPKLGSPITECFDVTTHLLAIQRGTRSGPQGDIPFEARVSDWRAVDDLKVPYLTEMSAGPLTFAGRVTAVELDVPIDPAKFAVPSPAGKAKGKEKGKAETKAPESGAATPPAPPAAPAQ